MQASWILSSLLTNSLFSPWMSLEILLIWIPTHVSLFHPCFRNIHTFEIPILLSVPHWIDLLCFMFNPSLRRYFAMTHTNWHYLTDLLGSLLMINKDFNRQFLSRVTTRRRTNRNYVSYLETTLLPGEESKEANRTRQSITVYCAASLSRVWHL